MLDRFSLATFVVTIATACASTPYGAPSSAPSDDGPKQPPSALGGDELALASTLPSQCAGPEIVRIARPVTQGDAASGRYSYGFRYKPASRAGAPVVVYMPGGPGMTSTDAPPEFLPHEWGYLLTDPRGVGCNTLASVPPPDLSQRFFRTAEIAHDVAAAIANRKLDDYVLYGISYGTMLATEVAQELESLKVARPKAVILEGVVGRAFDKADIGAPAIALWEQLRTVLPRDVVGELDSSAAPFGVSQLGWSQALSEILLGGRNVVSTFLTALSTENPSSDLRTEMLATLKSYADTPILRDPGAVELYRQTACRELDDTAPASDLDPIFSKGHLVRNAAEEGTKCGAIHVTTPYDSAKFQFTTPAYYFMGDSDIATPRAQGDYHFEHHTGPATRVVALGGGHLSLQLDQELCATDILTSIGSGGDDLGEVLALCQTPVRIDAK
jgi:pimeloyl-ACP methyl ester carboxylesterase